MREREQELKEGRNKGRGRKEGREKRKVGTTDK